MNKELQPAMGTKTGRLYKRNYRNIKEFSIDLYFILCNIRTVRRVTRGNLIPPAARERLMLAVTSVYSCRYCSWVHTREALKRGVGRDEVASLLTGSVDNCPEDESIALVYAQHWADSDACPDPEVLDRLEQVYGAEKAQAINLILRMIRIGNLTGNTWDCLLNRVSFGRLRKTERIVPKT